MTSGAPVVSNRIVTVSNALTGLRLLLVPVVLGVLLIGDEPGTNRRLIALAVFIAAAVTDRLDGALARSRGEITRFGVVADPIADKVLIIAVFAALAQLGELSWWVVGVVCTREVVATAVRFAVVRRGVIAAAASGKAKTVVQIVTASVLLVPGSLVTTLMGEAAGATFVTALVAVMLILTIASGAEVVIRAWRVGRSR